MRISTKLTISLTTVGLLVFIGYGFYEFSVERQDLQQVVSQQTRMLGKSLQIAIENALRDKQLEDIEELLKGLEQVEADLKIRVYDRQGIMFPEPVDTIYPIDFRHQLKEAIQQGAGEPFFYPQSRPELIALLLPLRNESDRTIGNLVLVRNLAEMRRDLDATERDLIISSLVFIAITAPLCSVIGLMSIGWPLKRLIDGMSRVKEGNFSPLPLKKRDDEIGVLLTTFNTMAAELKNAQDKLEAEVHSRIQMQSALQDADKLITIGQLSAGLAHEIGSPLQILKGRAEQLLQCAEHPDEVVRHARILVSQTERITRIVQQLLKFTRRRATHFARIDLRAPVQAVMNLLEHEAQRRQVELRFQAADRLPAIVADSDGVQQIVLNLVTNALAATSPGGCIVITLTCSQWSGSADDEQATEAVQLSVRDNGCGMAPEVLANLFEPFFTTRHEQGGVGLGLAVARGIVSAHHGTISAASVPGQGSTITVVFPVEEREHGFVGSN